MVSRANLRLFVDHAQELGDECIFPTERWATTFRSYAHRVFAELVATYGYDESNLPDTWYQEARLSVHSREMLIQEMNRELCGGFPP